MTYEEFKIKVEKYEGDKCSRGLLIHEIGDGREEWQLFFKTILICSYEKYIAKSYILEWFEKYESDKQNAAYHFFDYYRESVYTNLKFVYKF